MYRSSQEVEEWYSLITKSRRIQDVGRVSVSQLRQSRTLIWLTVVKEKTGAYGFRLDSVVIFLSPLTPFRPLR